MSKIVQILILSSLFSTAICALETNSTNEILEQATQATKAITAQLEPIIREEVIQAEVNPPQSEEVVEIIEENQPVVEVEAQPLEEEHFIQISLPVIEKIETNQTITAPMDKNISIEVIEQNLTKESNNTTPTLEDNQTKTLEEPTEKEIVEKGDPRKGKNIFKYVLKEDCNMTAYKFAEKYTQEEWLEILEENHVKETIIKNCPNVEKYYQDKWTDDLYQFFYEASNEDEIPEC
jgi:hypothetical protein